MISRERVKRSIYFGKPDRLPISHAVLPAAQRKYGPALEEILCEFRDDFGWDYLPDLSPDEYPPAYRKGSHADDFGVVWNCPWEGMCGIPQSPLRDLQDYEHYRWPDIFSAGPPGKRLYSGHMCGKDDRWYARGAWINYFESMHFLLGLENFFVALAEESRLLYRLLDDMLAFYLAWIDRWTRLDYDGLHFADDWGSQTGLLIRPTVWRRIFKPRYAEMFRRVKEAGMDIWFHSDGRINEIIPDLIELGVNVLNCQTRLIGLDWTAGNLRGRIALRTDIDRQHVLTFASPAQVKEEVFQTFEAGGTSQGGIIACGEIGPDVPLDNIRAMYEAFREYRP